MIAAPRHARRSARAAIVAASLALAPGARAGAPPQVVATIQPLAMLVRAIAGDAVAVSTLVPPGASPHTFEPQPSDIAALARARLVVSMGGGLDSWTDRLLAASAARPALLVLLDAPDLDPLPAVGPEHRDAADRAGAARRDPHAWLDPIRVRDALVPALTAALAQLDPAGAARYRARAAAFRDALTALDAEVRGILAGHGTQFVSFHAAWRYFAARYGLTEVAVVEEAPGEEPTPRALAALVARARAARVPAILIEPGLSPRIAQVLAGEFGGGTVLVDPLGDPRDPARGDYPGLMRWNARAFTRALGGATP